MASTETEMERGEIEIPKGILLKKYPEGRIRESKKQNVDKGRK